MLAQHSLEVATKCKRPRCIFLKIATALLANKKTSVLEHGGLTICQKGVRAIFFVKSFFKNILQNKKKVEIQDLIHTNKEKNYLFCYTYTINDLTRTYIWLQQLINLH